MKLKDKRGIIYDNVIFFVLTITFFVVMLTFLSTSLNTMSIYEQATAKQIALMIDQAKPDTVFSIDMKKLIDKFKIKKTVLELVKIDEKEKKVIVKLGDNPGYSYKYFSSTKIIISFQGTVLIFRVVKNA